MDHSYFFLVLVMALAMYLGGWRINVAVGIGVLAGLVGGLLVGGVTVLVARGVLGLVRD